MAVLSMAAFTSTTKTQKQFVFINNSKELLMKIREARLYNVTQKSVELGGGEKGLPRAYGINIKRVGGNIVTTTFADLATGTPNQFDDGANPDPVIGVPFSFDANKYILTLMDGIPPTVNPTPVVKSTFATSESLTVLYQPGELNVGAFYYDGTNTTMITVPHIYLEFKDLNNDELKKNIIIFSQSGIAEEIQTPSELN